MIRAYYNEIDKFAAEWLRNLSNANLISPGHVDNRSITDVQPKDLNGYQQCHFFAGTGAWSHALRLAGVPDDSVVWTGSPPCQDNSVASAICGKRLGLGGARSGLAHTWLNLVGAVQPGVVLFENVPGIEPWIGQITSRLAGVGYQLFRQDGAAADVGAPHPRRRVWIAAYRDGQRLSLARTARPPKERADPWAAAPRDIWGEGAASSGVLVNGPASRVATVRAIGNAICPQSAAEFIAAFLECE